MRRRVVSAVIGATAFMALSAPARSQQVPIFKAASRLVQFTVVVDGPRGVAGSLTKNDFLVKDNGAVQAISVFESNAAAQEHALRAAVLPPGEFSNRLPATAQSSPNTAIILLDCLNATTRMAGDPLHPSFDAAHGCGLGKEAIARYLAHLSPNDSVALWGLNAQQLVVLSDFSNNKEQLLAALRAFKAYDDPTAAAPLDDAAIAAGVGGGFAALLKNFDDFVSYDQHLGRSDFTKIALRAIANHLAQVPGRISLVWVTAAPCISSAEVAAALGSGRIAVYPVDARELVTRGKILQGGESPVAPVGHDAFSDFLTCSESAGQPSGQDNLRDIANQTGGVAFVNNNDLAAGIRQAVDDSADGYTLGFYMDGLALDNRFHKLRVTFNVHGLHARYPSGYWAFRDPTSSASVGGVAAVLASPVDAEAIPITAHIESAADKALIIRGTVGIGSLALRTKGGLHQGRLMIGLVGQTATGAIVQRMSNVIELELDGQRYGDALRNGLPFHQVFTPAAGVVTLRILAEDPATSAVGSLIIPLNAVH